MLRLRCFVVVIVPKVSTHFRHQNASSETTNIIHHPQFDRVF